MLSSKPLLRSFSATFLLLRFSPNGRALVFIRKLVDLIVPEYRAVLAHILGTDIAASAFAYAALHPKYVCKDGPVFRFDEIDELPNEY